MRARISSPLLLRVWSTTTPPRGPIYFPEGLPLSPLSFLSRRRSYVLHTSGCSSCRVYADAGSRGSFSRTHASSSYVVTLQHLHNKVVRFLFPVASLSRGKAIVVVACTFKSRPTVYNPFCTRFLYGTCVPRGSRRRIHLLLLLPSGIRRANTTVSNAKILQNY